MKKQIRITPEQTKELVQALNKKENVCAYRRIQAVMLRGEGKKVKEIMAITKFSNATITTLAKKYLEGGVAALLSDKRSGNNHYMTYEEEKLFLQDFIEKADKGQVITVKEMHIAYQEKLGKKTSSPAFYSLLSRHGWRKLMPRPKHPKKADAETIEASKKLTLK